MWNNRYLTSILQTFYVLLIAFLGLHLMLMFSISEKKWKFTTIPTKNLVLVPAIYQMGFRTTFGSTLYPVSHQQ